MIEVRNLKKSFGTQPILDGVNFRIENGESVVIIGRSGGGKSVLLKHLVGLLPPNSGQRVVDGENLDPIVSDSIDQLIMCVRDRLKVTSIVVTHDMRSARRVGNRVMLLHEKKIYASGAPEEFFASPDPVVRQFVDGVADPKEHLL